jgi:hypothetical protein
MNEKAWAAKFKKFARLAGVNEPKKELLWRAQGARRGRGLCRLHREPDDGDVRLTDPKMPAHYIAEANREKLGISGMKKIVAFDERQSLDDFIQVPEANSARTRGGNGVVTFPGNIRKKCRGFNAKRGFMVRSEGARIWRDFRGSPGSVKA